MSQTQNAAIAVGGIEIGKNSFHIVGHDERGAIVLRQKWSRGQVEARFANMPPCLVGMEACVGAHHLSRKLNSLVAYDRPGSASCHNRRDRRVKTTTYSNRRSDDPFPRHCINVIRSLL